MWHHGTPTVAPRIVSRASRSWARAVPLALSREFVNIQVKHLTVTVLVAGVPGAPDRNGCNRSWTQTSRACAFPPGWEEASRPGWARTTHTVVKAPTMGPPDGGISARYDMETPYGENFALLRTWTMTLWTCSRSLISTTLWTRLVFTRLVQSGLISTTKKLLPLYFAQKGAGTDWRPSTGANHGPPWWVNAKATSSPTGVRDGTARWTCIANLGCPLAASAFEATKARWHAL